MFLFGGAGEQRDGFSCIGAYLSALPPIVNEGTCSRLLARAQRRSLSFASPDLPASLFADLRKQPPPVVCGRI